MSATHETQQAESEALAVSQHNAVWCPLIDRQLAAGDGLRKFPPCKLGRADLSLVTLNNQGGNRHSAQVCALIIRRVMVPYTR